MFSDTDDKNIIIIILIMIVIILVGFLGAKISEHTKFANEKEDVFMRLCTNHYSYSKCVDIYDNGFNKQ